MEAPEIGQCPCVIILLQVHEAEIKEDAALARADGQGALVDLYSPVVPESAGIDDPQIPHGTYVFWFGPQNLLEAGFRGGIIACPEGFGSLCEYRCEALVAMPLAAAERSAEDHTRSKLSPADHLVLVSLIESSTETRNRAHLAVSAASPGLGELEVELSG